MVIMKAAVSVSLGLVFVGLATLNVITIFESSRLGRAPRSRARAIALHRAGGYLFIGLFALMVWFMSKRLIGSPEENSGDAALHIDLAVLLVPLLFLKVIIARKYKSYHAILMPLGLSIFAISVVLVLIRVLRPPKLHHFHRPSSRYRNRDPTPSPLSLSAVKCRHPMPRRFVFGFRTVRS